MENELEAILYNSFLYNVLKGRHKNAMNQNLIWLKQYWTMPPIVQFYTDHGRDHCLRLVEISDKFEWILGGLSESECFLLLMSILLHDIGMQADVQKFPEFSKYLEETYHIRPPRSIFKTPPTEDVQNYIRRNHHLLTGAMLLLMYQNKLGGAAGDRQLILNGAWQYVKGGEMQNIIDICKYHSKLDIQKLQVFRKPDRVRLLAALLRLFDELDITDRRVSMFFPAFNRIPLENAQYWNIHKHTQCNINAANKTIEMSFCLSPGDYSRYAAVFKKMLDQLKEKNGAVFDVIRIDGGYPLSYTDAVYQLDTESDFPAEIMKCILYTFTSDENRLEQLLKDAVANLASREQEQLFGLALRYGNRFLPPANSKFQKELFSNQLLTECRDGETCLRPQLLKIIYPLVKEIFSNVLVENDLDGLSSLPLLDAGLPVSCQKAQYEAIISPLLNEYQGREDDILWEVLLNALKRLQAEGDRGCAARNVVVLLMAAGYHFEGADLSGLNLSRVDFSWVRPDKEGFGDVSLQNVSLQGTVLRGTRFLEKLDQTRSCIFIDGNHCVTGDASGYICVWSVEPLEMLCWTSAHQGPVWGLAYDEQEKLLFSCSHDGKLVCCTLDRGADDSQPWTLSQKGDCLTSLGTWLTCLDRHGDLLATAGGDGNIYIYNTKTRAKFSCKVTCGTVTYHSIRFDYSGRFLLAGDNLGGLLLLQLNAEGNGVEDARSYKGIAKEMICSIESHPRRSLFYISGGVHIIVVEAEEFPPYLTIHNNIQAHGNYIKKLALYSDGSRLFSTANDRRVRLWKLDKPTRPEETLQFQSEDVYSNATAISPDGRFLLGAVQNSLTLCLWDLPHTEELCVIRGYHNWLSSLCFLHNETYFVSGDSTGYVKLWTYSEEGRAENVQNLYRHPYAVNPIAVSPDDCYLISGSSSASGDIYIWDMREKRMVDTIPAEIDQGLRSLVFIDIQEGRYRFASAGFDNMVRLWTFDPVKKEFTQEILSTRFPGFLGSCAVSRNRAQLAFSVLSEPVTKFEGDPLNIESHNICVVNLRDGNTKDTIFLKTDRIQTLAFSPDGSLLACGDTKGGLHFISMDSPGEVKYAKVSKEHIGCVSFSSAGDILACADGSGCVSLWDPVEGALLSRRKISSGLQLHTIVFSPDDRTVLTAGMDGEVHILPVSGGVLGSPVDYPCIRPYEGLCLKGATGLTPQRLATLELLGAQGEGVK